MPDRETGRFAQFRTPEEGLEALERDIRAKQSGNSVTGLDGSATLEHFSQVWLGGRANRENSRETQRVHLDGMMFMLRDFDVTKRTPIGTIPTWALAQAVAYVESETLVVRSLKEE